MLTNLQVILKIFGFLDYTLLFCYFTEATMLQCLYDLEVWDSHTRLCYQNLKKYFHLKNLQTLFTILQISQGQEYKFCKC